ncbi:class I adenylate-forming enzyme family protein [Bacillus cereus]|uniref:class I adenylate-forming enzyme family protein n=1 Tax=Bacillus cereus TaxID=1396 RepID=UPI0008FEA107|nr:class I adenylate-forming enzyme family protein [Bacillus cereus]OJD95138.1 hypothetical protein A9485_00670 [Bacillus cereus]
MIYNQIKKNNPEHIAFIRDEKEVSYKEYIEEIEKCRSTIIKIGLSQSKLVGLCLKDSYRFSILFVSLCSLKIPIILLDPYTKSEEFQTVINMYKPSILITDTKKLIDIEDDIVIEEKMEFEKPIRLFNLRTQNLFFKKNKSVDEGNLVIFLSSGSTNIPKAVLKSEKRLLNEGLQLKKTLDLKEEERILSIAPIFHAYGFAFGFIAPLISGVTITYLPALTLATKIEKVILEREIEILIALPVHYEMLASHCKSKLTNLRYALTAGGILNQEVLTKCEELIGLNLNNVYGMTETGAISILHEKYENKLYNQPSVGKVISDTSVLLNYSDPVESKGLQIFEILIKNKSMTMGYLDGEGNLDSIIDKKEYFKTGDLGILDEKCHLYIYGKQKLTINVSGKKVNPLEVEEVIQTHPAVKEAVVVGQEDSIRGEIPVAHIVLNHPSKQEEILSHCRRYLSAYKVPRKIFFQEKLEQTSTGKVKRQALKENL